METADIAMNIRRAREAAGLDQVTAAEAAGLSRAAYRSLEEGRSRPRDKSLVALAQAFGVGLEELLRPAVPLPRARFRSLKRLKDRTGLLIDVGAQLQDYADLEDELGAHVPFDLTRLIRGLPSGRDRPVEAALRARKALGLDEDEPIRDIGGLLEDSAGVKVLCLDIKSDGFFGLSVGAGDGGPAVVVNTWERIPVERWIFTAAHELGHLLLHQGDYDPGEATEVDQSEREADLFASHFLMPASAFNGEWHGAAGLAFYDRVLKVKRIFRVSYKTVLYRVQEDFGLPDVWARFQAEARRRTGRTLTRSEEPRALGSAAFGYGSPERSNALEPDRLSTADFGPDRRSRLVREAVETERISISRAAEILRRPLADMKALQASWA